MPDGQHPRISAEEREALIATLSIQEQDEALDLIAGLFGIDTVADTDPLIDMPMIAELAGVSPGTPGAWQQRTKKGIERVAFPEPADDRYEDKPQWNALSQIVAGFLKPSGRWPRGTAARTRAPRISFDTLKNEHPTTADALKGLRGDDGRARTVQGWRARLTTLRNNAPDAGRRPKAA